MQDPSLRGNEMATATKKKPAKAARAKKKAPAKRTAKKKTKK